ncbi:MAG TPA: pilus assembly protein TadG-related protein [Gammaproteobacteria bacterium]
MPRYLERRAPPCAQRGAIGIFGGLAMSIALAFVVLALDTGRLALEKRRLQEIADLAAIDAVQQAGQCSGTETMTAATVRTAAQQSALRNGYAGDLSSEAGAVLLGIMTTDADGVRQFTGTVDAAASAVQVTARKSVVRSLVAGGWYGGTVDLQAVGVAQREPWAGFWVGSFLASIDSEDSAVLNAVLGGMLGSAVSLNALSYEGLVDADLTLAQLIDGAALAGVSLSANSVEGLLASNVTAADFLSIMAAALGADTDGDATAAAAVNDLQAAATVAGTINIGELLSVTADDPESALNSQVNAYALGSAALQLAREGETVNLSAPVSIPLVGATVDVSMHITEAPQIAIGPPGRDENGNWKTAASTAQMQLQIDASVTDAPLFAVLLGVVNASLDVSIAAEVARTDAWLASIDCAGASQPAHRVTVGASPGTVNLALGRYADLSDPGSLDGGISADITLASTSIASASISAETSLGNAAQDVEFDVFVDPLNPPQWNLPQQQTLGTSLASALDTATQSLADSLVVDDPVILGGALPLGVTTGAIQGALPGAVLEPVLTTLDAAVLDPLFGALGIHAGGADIELFSLDADESRLVR